MANYDEILRQHAERIAALESECATPEEKEINRFLQRVVQSVRSTFWLANGIVKYGAGPLGIAFGLWIWGETAVEWIVSKFTGLPR